MLLPVKAMQSGQAIPAQNHARAGLFHYPAVSQTQIAFMFANDIWLVPRAGGNAQRLLHRPGQESFPKFSPNGRTLALMGNFDGNSNFPSGVQLQSHSVAG